MSTFVSGPETPVEEESDVLAEFSSLHRRPETAPVRDAFVSGFTEGFRTYQEIAEYASAQCDPLRATGDQLSAFAEERGLVRGPSESEEDLRSRLFSAPVIVTPDAIVTRVNEVLAPYTSKQCTFCEPEMDGIFAQDGTASWSSFIGADPDYPDRYYDSLPSLDPGGALLSTGSPRTMRLRIPALEGNDISIAYVLNASDDGVFIDDGTGDYGTYVFINPQLAQNIYEQIIALVESIKGQSISWSLLVDPDL